MVQGPTGVEGTVVDADTGQPLAGVTVVAQSTDPAILAISDTSGRYFFALPVGTFTVVAYFGSDQATVPRFTTRAGLRTRVNIRMRVNCAGGELSGHRKAV